MVVESQGFPQSSRRTFGGDFTGIQIQGPIMKRTLAFAVALGLSATTGNSTANADASRTLPPAGRPVAVAAAPTAPAVRKLHAVLRYDATTAAACRTLSDAPSELCLLLALHIIQMSEKPLPTGAL